jgi:hypothetical protein
MWGYWSGLGTIVILKVRVFMITSKGQDMQPVDSGKNWVLQPFKVLLPLIYYAPAYLLVWFSFNQFGSFNERKEQQNTVPLTLEQKVLKLEKEVGIKENATKNSLEDRIKSLERQVVIKDKAENVNASEAGKDYVVGIIEKESRAQADKASADAVDKAKSELFSQISFPVLFAIASIFAAFAVKDILVEILKSDERKELERSLNIEINRRIAKKLPQAIESSPVYQRFQSSEIFVAWLEYDTTLRNITEVLSGVDSSVMNAPNAHEDICKMLEHLERTYDLMFVHFHGGIDRSAVNLLKKAQYSMLRFNIGSSQKLDPIRQSQLDRELVKKIQIIDSTRKSHSPIFSYERSEGIYDMQRRLLLNKLDEMKKSNPSLSSDIDKFKIEFQKSEKEIRDKRVKRNDAIESQRSVFEQVSAEYSDNP